MGYRLSQVLGTTAAITALLIVVGCSKQPAANDAEEASAPSPTAETGEGTAVQKARAIPTAPSELRAVPLRPADGQEAPRFTDSQGDAASIPPIRVLPPTLDWGIVAPRAIVSGSVQLQNISSNPVKILTVQPSCKCTTTRALEGVVIPSGGSVELEAELEAQPNPGPRTTQIRILFEGYSQVVTVPAKADVSRTVRVRPPYINAVSGQNATGSLLVSSVDRRPFKIMGVQGNPPKYSGQIAPEEERNSYILDYDIADFVQPDGRYPRYVVIETDRADCPLIEVMLRHEESMPKLSPIFKPRVYQLSLGRTAPGGSLTFDMGIRESTTTGPLIAALVDERGIQVEILDQSIDDATDDLNVKLLFKVAPDKPEGFYYFPVRLYASNQADITIPAFISVRNDPGRASEPSATSDVPKPVELSPPGTR